MWTTCCVQLQNECAVFLGSLFYFLGLQKKVFIISSSAALCWLLVSRCRSCFVNEVICLSHRSLPSGPQCDMRINTLPLAFVPFTLLFPVSLFFSAVFISAGSLSSFGLCYLFLFCFFLPPSRLIPQLKRLSLIISHCVACRQVVPLLRSRVTTYPWKRITEPNDASDLRWAGKSPGSPRF